MRITWTAAIVAAIALAGCATPAEQAARMEREMDRQVEIYGPACDRLGFKRDTDPWRHCILDIARQQNYDRYGYYSRYPMSTTCFGGPGLLNCMSF